MGETNVKIAVKLLRRAVDSGRLRGTEVEQDILKFLR